MAAAGKRHKDAETEEPENKRPRISADAAKRAEAENVQLNPADCNLDFNVEGNGLQGHALYKMGFAYCWSGARATVGIRGGKYCFSCKVIDTQPVVMDDTAPDQQHLCRVGVSRGDDNVGNLGESEHSFGFGGTGKFSTAGKFSDYGSKFSVGDTILCAVNLESRPLAEISFYKNGACLGVAKRFDAGPKGLEVVDSPLRKLAWESALFPHVLLKNVIVQMEFSVEDGLVPPEGYKPWSAALQDGNGVIGPQFGSLKECEVLMMVGLPASGKTTWAENWAKEHPEKRYMVLGTNLALDQMKVPGLLRKHNYGERFDRLMDRATGIFNTLLDRAAKTPRNYILDQTNVYKSARKRKLKPFVGYHKIAVVIFPNDEQLKLRAAKRFREMGKEVPAEAVNEMLANYVLPMTKDMPHSDEFFNEVWFPELKRDEAQKILEKYKSELKSTPKAQNTPPTHSRSSSVGSFHDTFSSPRMPYTGASPVAGGSWRGSPAPPMDRSVYNTPPKVGDHYPRMDMDGFRERSYQSDVFGPQNSFARSELGGFREPTYGRDFGDPRNTFQRTDGTGYREIPQYRDQRSPFAANLGPQFGSPPISAPYGMSDPGRQQNRPSMPPSSYAMQPRPGWEYQPYR